MEGWLTIVYYFDEIMYFFADHWLSYFILDSEERSYPAYVSTASSYQRSSSMAAKIPGMRPYPVAAATSEEESDSEKPTDDRVSILFQFCLLYVSHFTKVM